MSYRNNTSKNYSKVAETVDALPLDGSPKSYKPYYVGKYMSKSDKLEDEILNANDIADARHRIMAIIGYVPGPYDKIELHHELKSKYEELLNEKILEKQKGDPSKQVILDETKDKLAAYIDASMYILGRVREKFDDAFGWYEKRCMMVVGPFGGGEKGVRRTFIGDGEIPKDGEYVNVKTGEKVTIRLNSIIKRSINQAFKSNPIDPMEESQDGNNSSTTAPAR